MSNTNIVPMQRDLIVTLLETLQDSKKLNEALQAHEAGLDSIISAAIGEFNKDLAPSAMGVKLYCIDWVQSEVKRTRWCATLDDVSVVIAECSKKNVEPTIGSKIFKVNDLSHFAAQLNCIEVERELRLVDRAKQIVQSLNKRLRLSK